MMRSAQTRTVGRRSVRAFTLLEMMLVVAIIGILATVVIVSIGGQSDEAKRGATVAKLAQLKGPLGSYYARYSQYPEKLDALVEAGYIEKMPLDGWNRPFVYYTPAQEQGKPYTLFSTGKDNQANTNDDVNVWTMDEVAPPQ